MNKAALRKAIRYFGTMAKLAQKLGVRQQNVSYWLNQADGVPMPLAIQLAKLVPKVTWLELVSPEVIRSTQGSPINPLERVRVPIARITGNGPKVVEANIQALVDDIQQHSLQRPIIIDSHYRLILGRKRLQAYAALGKKTIPAYRLSWFELLKDPHIHGAITDIFTLSEQVEMGLALERYIGKRRGRNNPENFPELKGKETREIVAKCLGFCNSRTYEHAKRVILSGHGALIQAMDQKHIAISTAALLSRLPQDQQAEALKSDKKALVALAKHIQAPTHLNPSL